MLSAYSAYEWSLGVKSVAWSPSSQFLAIGSYDEKVSTLWWLMALMHKNLHYFYKVDFKVVCVFIGVYRPSIYYLFINYILVYCVFLFSFLIFVFHLGTIRNFCTCKTTPYVYSLKRNIVAMSWSVGKVNLRVPNRFVHFVSDFPLLCSCQVRILNHITWKKVAQFEHPATISNTKAVSLSAAAAVCFLPRVAILILSAARDSRWCTRKWSEGRNWAATTCLHTASQLTPPSLTPTANVCCR